MQSVSSKIWTHVAVSISYDDNDYTTGTSDFMGRSMNLTVAGQRPSVQNSIVVLFPDIFMNFWLLSYRNLNRYVI